VRGAELLRFLAVAAVAAVIWRAAADLPAAPRLMLLFLLIVLPLLMVAQATILRQLADAGELPSRLAMYGSSAMSLWVLALLAAGAARLGGLDAHDLFLRAVPLPTLLAWSAGLTLAGTGLVLLAFRAGMRDAGLTGALLPRTPAEKIAWVGVSVTAGVCEEFVYRGFLIAGLAIATGSLAVAVVVAAAAFGFVHAYQQPAGVLRAALIGLLLTAPVLALGSILPAIIAHAAYDLIAGYWLGPRLLRDA
jgi:membrane protease YdiL (CAAX protease family)